MEPKITLVESWYWITIFFVVIIGAALQFFKEDDISVRAKRRINFWLFVFGFIGAVAALFDKCNDTRSQKQLSSNVDSVKNTSTKNDLLIIA